MTNEIYSSGLLVKLIAPTGGVTAGVPILIGNMVVVPVTTQAVGEEFAAKRGNVVTVAKATGTGALGQGVEVDWDPPPGNVVAAGSVTDNHRVGYLLEAAGDTDTTCSLIVTTDSVTAH